MKTFATCIAVNAVACALAMPAAARDVNESMNAAEDGRVSISNTSGSIEVQGWSRDQVAISGSVGDEVEELVFERSGDNVRIKVKVPEGNRRFHDVSADLVIRVPAQSSLDVATISADIEVRGVKGEQDLQAISGDIDSEAFAGDIDAETVSGDIEVQGDGKKAQSDLQTVSGDIAAQRIAGDVDAETVSGDIGIADSSVERADLETVNGSITFRATLESDGRLDIETVNGRVDVDFVGKVSARFDIETFNGRIRNCFGPKPERTSKYAPGWELSFTHGDGDGRVTIATLNGGLNLCMD
ncbi:MAG: DUF4097 family beta strand repeat-containing protein [Pseudomonadota bacterium]